MTGNASQSGHLRTVGAFAGMGSGLTKVAVGHGFDTIKTRLQCSPPGTYHGAIDVLTKILRNEGVLALYKGATPPAVGWAAIDSLLLGSLHNYRLFLIRHGMTEPTRGTEAPRLTLLAHGIAGLCAGFTSTLIATPVELLKVKLQLQSQRSVTDRQFKGPIDCARQIIRTQGILGLWSGFTGSLAFRSNFFWMFLSFEAFMRGFSRLAGTPYEISTGSANFVSGGLGAFAFWGMAIPADNIKNRMMAHPYPLPYAQLLTSAIVTRPSFFLTARQIYSRDGISGFFRGLGPCLLRAFPVNACAFFVYEGSMRVLGAEKTRH
ncbi:Mitochondrial substrate carrier family protein L [Hypsizygus marmoreus]|uniref:Mitochondrial substrate carrier family protein L n=1 Tax=Hypsizygus marmoreus TaxID=39966 RepID=A0A369K3Q6_HYPMA|nr:Mitochondrial substrate carrier family protein L [Hypsizygus marmoreus]